MPNLSFLKERVQKIIKDPSYDKELTDMFNIALREISWSEEPLVLLPDLETSADVITGEGYITFSTVTTALPSVGDTITGSNDGYTATVTDVIITSGMVSTNDAVGYVSFKDITSGQEFDVSEIITYSGGSFVVTAYSSDPLPYVTLPSDYARHLYHVKSANFYDARIGILPSAYIKLLN